MNKIKNNLCIVTLFSAIVGLGVTNILLIFVFNRVVDKQYIVLQIFLFFIIYVAVLFVFKGKKKD